jgi:hypothetical protein
MGFGFGKAKSEFLLIIGSKTCPARQFQFGKTVISGVLTGFEHEALSKGSNFLLISQVATNINLNKN